MSTTGGSRDALQQALEAARDAGNASEQARILRQLAGIERAEGHGGRARRLLERALEIYRETNDLRGVTAVMGELAPVADAQHVDGEAPGGGASDLITMRPTSTGPRLSPAPPQEGGSSRLLSAPPGGSRREGTSWPVAVGFLVLLLAVAGGVAFLAIRLVGDFADRTDAGTEEAEPPPVSVTVEPDPVTTRLPANGGEDDRALSATPQSCEVTSGDVFGEVSMQVRLVAKQPFQVVVLRGTLTARGGREIANGITPVTPVGRGTQRVPMTFTVFDDVPRGRLTCGVEIETAVPQL